MITQSLHFEVTGRDAEAFWRACHVRNMEPVQAFELFLSQFTQDIQNDKEVTEADKADDVLRAKKLAFAGRLARFAKPELMALENQAVDMAIKEKYGTD